jgi:hypothetical protein
MLAGAVGLLAISTTTIAGFVGGAVLLAVGQWGWAGLLLSAALRGSPDPARGAAAIQSGFFAGGAAGPVVFGSLLELIPMSAALAVGAGLTVVAAAIALAGHRMAARDRA